MAHPPSAESLEAERRQLSELENASVGARLIGYWKLIGPGYLQSAMTLGSGTAASSLLAGALFGYSLLWVAPIAMLMGIIMLAAISYQTLSTRMRPLTAMRTYASPLLAWGWALGAIVASVIWHLPQYALAAACIADIGKVLGIENLDARWLGFPVLAWAIATSMMYGSSPRFTRIYERILKYMVWGVVLCFGLVVARTGISDWGALLRGFTMFEIPEGSAGVSGMMVVLSGLSAAVGINMVFLYPYSLLARGWGREHRRLARFDLLLGMLLPYFLATSLMVIATANSIHPFEGTGLAPVEAAQSLSAVVGPTLGRVVFNIGILGMALTSITLQMLTAGFVCMELFGWEVGSAKYRLATLLPAPGVLGPVIWNENLLWLAVPTNIVCGLLLPIAYIGFVILHRSKRYLGADMPAGARGRLWTAGMILITLVLTVWLGGYALTKLF